MCIPQFHVLTILEHILGIALQIIYLHIIAEHEWIGAFMNLQILRTDMAATPENLVCIVDANVLQFYVMHFAEHLGTVNHGIFHCQVVAVPQCRTGTHSEMTICDGETVNMPERIFPFKIAVLSFYVATFFDGTLALPNRYLFQTQVMGFKQRTFAFKSLVLYLFHIQEL